MTLEVGSESIRAGEPIDVRFAVATPTPDGRAELAGADVSPHLRWSGEPEGTRSFALSVVDPVVPADASRMEVQGLPLGEDEARMEFAHWLVVDIPSGVHEITEGADSDGFVPHGKPPGPTSFGGISGQNGYTGLFAGSEERAGTYGGWDGPYPPWNDEILHRYVFTVHALDVPTLRLEPGFTLDAFRRAIEGHELDSGGFEAIYTLNPRLG